jgi:endonuclease/exonuclease/phosphatase family metal-dependent hydrolase
MVEVRELMATGKLSRRNFIGACGALGLPAVLGISPARVLAAQPAPRLRTITYNILACKGYPASESTQPYLERAKRQIATRLAFELALYAPDIISFQESPSKELVADIARQLGMNHAYFPGGFPGAIVTRLEIVTPQNCPLEQGERPDALFTRHWGRAILRTGNEEISFYSAHLHPSNDEVRAREVTEALKVIDSDLKKGGPLLFQGDLNHTPDGPEYERWSKAGLIDCFARKGGGIHETFGSTKPEKRIDYIWTNASLGEKVLQCRVLFEGAFRTNPEDPRSFALSDHLPVMASFA